jgi:hypothetical protein
MMRIFERLRVRMDPPPIQPNEAKEARKFAVPAPDLDPQPDGMCCGHCSGKPDAAVNH